MQTREVVITLVRTPPDLSSLFSISLPHVFFKRGPAGVCFCSFYL